MSGKPGPSQVATDYPECSHFIGMLGVACKVLQTYLPGRGTSLFCVTGEEGVGGRARAGVEGFAMEQLQINVKNLHSSHGVGEDSHRL